MYSLYMDNATSSHIKHATRFQTEKKEFEKYFRVSCNIILTGDTEFEISFNNHGTFFGSYMTKSMKWRKLNVDWKKCTNQNILF